MQVIKNKFLNQKYSSFFNMLRLLNKTQKRSRNNSIFTILIVIIASCFESLMFFSLNSLLSSDFNNNINVYEALKILIIAFTATGFRIIGGIRNFNSAGILTSDILRQVYKNFLYKEDISSGNNLESIILGLADSLNRAFGYFLMFLSTLITSVFIVITVFILLPTISLVSAILLIGTYSLSFYLIAPILDKNSNRISQAVKSQSLSLQRTSGLIREIKNWLLQDNFEKEFVLVDKRMRSLSAQNDGLLIVPRYILDLIIIVLILCLNIFFVNQDDKSLLVILTTLGLAAQRLLPTIQTVYGSLSGIKRYKYEIINILNDLETDRVQDINRLSESNRLRDFSSVGIGIIIDTISYKAYDNNKTIISNFSLSVKQSEKLLLKGSSGVGKTTLLELISGNKFISNGSIKYSNGQSNLIVKHDFLPSILPQNSYIGEETVGFNITLERNPELWDTKKLNYVINLAEINFIQNFQQYQLLTILNPKRISGGQLQRIGIARALYRNKGLLLLDEPTSSLDIEMGLRILQRIIEEYRESTIIIVTHQDYPSLQVDRQIQMKYLTN